MNKNLKDTVIRAVKTWDLSHKYDEKSNATIYVLASKKPVKLILRYRQYVNLIPALDNNTPPPILDYAPLILDCITLELKAQYNTERGEHSQILAYARIPAYKIYGGMINTNASEYDLYEIYKTVSERKREIERANDQMGYTTSLVYKKLTDALEK